MTQYGGLTVHPLADKFPLMEGEEFEALVLSIKFDGQYNPIAVSDDGKILIDGRNRYRACLKAGVAPRMDPVGLMDEDEIISFIVAQNVKRRQLSTTDLALMAVEVEKAYAESARNRMLAGVADPETDPSQGRAAQSIERAAEEVGVGRTSAQVAKRVMKAAEEEAESGIKDGPAMQLLADVKSKKKSLNAADEELRQTKASDKRVPAVTAPDGRRYRIDPNKVITNVAARLITFDYDTISADVDWDNVDLETAAELLPHLEHSLKEIRKFIKRIQEVTRG